MLVRELYDLLWRNTNLLFEADIVVNEKLSNNMNMKAKKFLAGGESVFAQQLLIRLNEKLETLKDYRAEL